jgi:hypothetical protein
MLYTPHVSFPSHGRIKKLKAGLMSVSWFQVVNRRCAGTHRHSPIESTYIVYRIIYHIANECFGRSSWMMVYDCQQKNLKIFIFITYEYIRSSGSFPYLTTQQQPCCQG